MEEKQKKLLALEQQREAKAHPTEERRNNVKESTGQKKEENTKKVEQQKELKIQEDTEVTILPVICKVVSFLVLNTHSCVVNRWTKSSPSREEVGSVSSKTQSCSHKRRSRGNSEKRYISAIHRCLFDNSFTITGKFTIRRIFVCFCRELRKSWREHGKVKLTRRYFRRLFSQSRPAAFNSCWWHDQDACFVFLFLFIKTLCCSLYVLNSILGETVVWTSFFCLKSKGGAGGDKVRLTARSVCALPPCRLSALAWPPCFPLPPAYCLVAVKKKRENKACVIYCLTFFIGESQAWEIEK